MPRTHTHHPDGKGPVCRFATKRECDQFYREYRAAEKEAFEQREAERERLKKEQRVAAFDAFIASELERMSLSTSSPSSTPAPQGKAPRTIRIPSFRGTKETQ